MQKVSQIGCQTMMHEWRSIIHTPEGRRIPCFEGTAIGFDGEDMVSRSGECFSGMATHAICFAVKEYPAAFHLL